MTDLRDLYSESYPPSLWEEPEVLRATRTAAGGYDPGEHTVDEVKTYVSEHPDERAGVLTAEQAGKERSTLIAWLEETT